MMLELKLVLANVNSMNSPRKHKWIFYQLEKYKDHRYLYTYVYIKYTNFVSHIKEKDGQYLENWKLGKLYYVADKDKKKRGVAIYMKINLDSKLKWRSENGRILMVKLQI